MPRSQYQRSAYRLDAGFLGHLEGVTVSSHDGPLMHYFGGIPYALPPVGPYRFRRPRELPACYRYGTKASPGRFTQQTATCPQVAWRGQSTEALWDEDCLQLNIHVPHGKPPSEKGWPVFFYIHGGFLQWGSPNDMGPESIAPLLSETAFKAIIVMPAYRLNSFGFLASKELQAEAERNGETSAGNVGFWDQRLALEWTWKKISHFGGDASNITVGGYSAGSHSAFQQLAHELYFVPDDEAIIKRAIMWSNSPGCQPKTLIEHQKQFDEYLTRLNIPLTLSAERKLERLRALPAKDLVKVQDNMTISEFRALSDDSFISKSIVAHINSGDFARRMKKRGIKLINGECRDEHNLYRAWRTPKEDSYEAVYTRLCADYPEKAVKKLMEHYCGGPGSQHSLPTGVNDWIDLFGHLYAKMQVHCLERGFQNALINGGLEPGVDLFRYRFEWRAQCVKLPEEWGVTHATDMAIWFWGEGELTDEEKKTLRPWNERFATFVAGDDIFWGTKDAREALILGSDGQTGIWQDDMWDEGLELWKQVNSDTSGIVGWVRSRL